MVNDSSLRRSSSPVRTTIAPELPLDDYNSMAVHHSYTTISQTTMVLPCQNAQPVRCMSLNLRSNAISNPTLSAIFKESKLSEINTYFQESFSFLND